MMDLRLLRSFVAVAGTLNFSRAAERLSLSQPALSRQIRELEDRLGTRVFDRSDGKVTLTEGGTLLLEGAVALLEQAEALEKRVRAHAAGRRSRIVLAHFGTLIAVYLAPFLSRWRRLHPQLAVDLVELEPADAWAELRAGRVQAVVSGRPQARVLGQFAYRTVWRVPPRYVLPAGHALAKRRRIRLADLAGEPWAVWPESRFPGFGEPFFAACRHAGFEPRVVREVSSVGELFAGVADGGFVGYVGRLADQLPQVGLVLKAPVDGDIDMPVILAWRHDDAEAAALGALATMLEAAAEASGRGAGPE